MLNLVEQVKRSPANHIAERYFMEEATTWDTAIESAALPPPTGETPEQVAEPIIDSPQPATDETPEAQTTGEVENADQPAREPETPAADKEATTEPEPKVADDLQQDDPEEVKALPTPAARRWARGRDREARLVDAYLDPEVPALDVANRLYEKSQSRYTELVNGVGDAHWDYLVSRKLGISAEELDGRLKAIPETPSHDQTRIQDDPSYDPLADPLVPDTEKALIREAKQAREESAALKAQMEQVTGKVSTFEQAEEERKREIHVQKAQAIEQELRESVMSVIPEEIREYGLEVSDQDIPLIKGLKKAAQFILNTDLVPTFDADADNVKAVSRATHFADKLERDNAFKEEDALKVRVRGALGKVKEREDVRAIFEAIETVGKFQSEKLKTRGKGQPPAPPNASPGTVIASKQIASWEDAEAAAAGR